MEKSKVKHQLKSSPNSRKPKLSEINELSYCVVIIKREQEDKLKNKINELGGHILSIVRGIGVSRNSVFESLRVGTDDVSVFFLITRIEDVRDFMSQIAEEFSLAVPGNGKGFTIDIDGYLGAKAVFIE